jgi:hypothetical protein
MTHKIFYVIKDTREQEKQLDGAVLCRTRNEAIEWARSFYDRTWKTLYSWGMRIQKVKVEELW